MSTIAILPVKTFGSAKQRLSSALEEDSRRVLARAMFIDVLAALHGVRQLDEIAVVTADREAAATARSERAEVVADTKQAGQSPAALLGVAHARAAGHERVLLVPGDTPLLDPGELTALLRRAEEERLGVVIVPDRHGEGTNALVLSPPDAMEPAFGPGSRRRHVERARAAGVRCAVEEVPTLALDVDTGQDLEALEATLASRRGGATATRAALGELDGRRRPPVPA